MATERRLAARAWPDANLEIRLIGDGMTFEGYAAVFGSDSERMARWGVEQIAPGAFTRSLSEDPDIRMFLNHNTDALLASTKAGTLRLSEDDYGLRVQADLPDTNHGRDLATLIRRGDVRSMSFGFEPVKYEARTDGVDGFIHTEVRLAEVSPVTSWPAYTATTAAVRTIESSADFRAAARRARSLEQQAVHLAEFRTRGDGELSGRKQQELSDIRNELLTMLDRLPATDGLAKTEVDGTREWLRTLDPQNPTDMAHAAETVASVTDSVERFWRAENDPAMQAMRPQLDRIFAHEATSADRTKANKMSTEFRDGYKTALSGQHVELSIDLSPDFAEGRALQSGGGSAIPTTFSDRVTVYERTATPMLDPNIVTLLATRSGEDIILPRLTADVSHGGTVTAEAAAINELDPTISSVTLDSYKYAVINLWSSELDLDNVIGLEELMARSTGRELGLDIGTALTTGDGSDEPNGFVTAATVSGTAQGTAVTGGDTFFGWPDLADLMHSVAAPYRAEGAFMVSSDALTKITKFRDADGRPILDISSGAAPRLWGRPVYENPAMASVGSASKSVAFGSWKSYFVRRVTPVRIELSRDYRFSTDQVALRTIERVDGDLVDVAGIRTLVSANT